MRQRVVRGCLAFLATLLLAGCQFSAPKNDEPDPRVAVAAAVDALAGQTAVAYRISADAILNVTRNGLVQGSLPLLGQQVRAFRAGGDLYLFAPSAYWEAQGMAAARATEYGTRWARAATGAAAFDPGSSLTPSRVSEMLKAGLPVKAVPVKAALPDGTEVFDVAGLRVTAVQPYRVVSVAPALLGPVVAQSFGSAPVYLDGLTGAGLASLRAGLDDAVASLGQPFVAGPVVAATVTDNNLSCSSGGSCTDKVRVENRLVGEASNASARLVLNAPVTSPALGSRSCGQELVVPLNTSTEMSCSVKFELPRANGSTKVVAEPSVVAEPVATVDPDGLKREVAAELGG